MAQAENKQNEPSGLISLGHRGLSTAEDEKELDKLLSDEKVDVNRTDDQGLSCLHWACANGHRKLVQTLVTNSDKYKKDLDLNLKSKKGETALHKLAINTKDGQETAIELAKWFLTLTQSKDDKNNKNNNNKKDKNDKNDKKSGNIILDVNAINNWGETALHCAIQNRNSTMVELLLNIPSMNVILADKWGRTALDVSQEYGMTSIEQEKIWKLLTESPQVTKEVSIFVVVVLFFCNRSNVFLFFFLFLSCL